MKPFDAQSYVRQIFGLIEKHGYRPRLETFEQFNHLLFIYYFSATNRMYRFTGGMPSRGWPGHWKELAGLDPGKVASYCNDLLNSMRHSDAPLAGLYTEDLGTLVFPGRLIVELLVIIERIAGNFSGRGDAFSPGGWGALHDALLLRLGQYERDLQVIPAAIARLMFELASPEPGDRVLDPACQTGSLFAGGLSSGSLMDELVTEGVVRLVAFERDPRLLRFAIVSMALRGADNVGLEKKYLLDVDSRENRHDIIFCAPPFGIKLDRGILPDELKALPSRSEVVYLHKISTLFRKRACVLLPGSFASNATAGVVRFREELLRQGLVRALLALPAGSSAFPGSRLCLLLLDKERRAGDHVFFYDLDAQLAPGGKNTGQWGREFEDAVSSFHGKGQQGGDRSGHCFTVSAQEMLEKDASFEVNAYREVVYQPLEYEPIHKVIDDIRRLEKDLAKRLDELDTIIPPGM